MNIHLNFTSFKLWTLFLTNQGLCVLVNGVSVSYIEISYCSSHRASPFGLKSSWQDILSTVEYIYT